MTIAVSGWKRLWILVSGLLFIAFVVLALRNWPRQSDEVIRGVDAPACKYLRDMPEGFYPDHAYIHGDECDALLALMTFSKVNISSRADYQNHLVKQRWELSWLSVFLWLFASIGLYVLGSAIGWVVAGFRKAGA